MMKAITAAALILVGMTATSVADNPYRLGFVYGSSGGSVGTDLVKRGIDYRHYDDLYQRNGYTTTARSDCHRHVSRAPGMRFHANTQCHRHDPWLHPSLDYGRN